MKLVDYSEYLDYVSKRNTVIVEGEEIELKPIKVKRMTPLPEELTDSSSTVWSFPKRGSWATHRGDYRGNWPPQVARLLIERYSDPGGIVLDPMIGSGTTCIEAKLLGRNCIGVDISYEAVILTLHRLYWLEKALENPPDDAGGIGLENARRAVVEIYHGDARRLSRVGDETIDLVITHPPYFNIIKYSSRVDGDLSRAGSLEEYLKWFNEVVGEIYRVLKPGGHLGILIGDTRIRKHYVPISHYVLEILLRGGFIIREEVVKIQHKMKTTREVWSRFKDRDFLLIYHEKLYVMRKPRNREEYEKYKYSAYMDLDYLTS